MSDKKFKHVAIGDPTPEILLAQALEMKWKGIVILGLIDESHVPEEKRGPNVFHTVANSAGLNAAERSLLLHKFQSLIMTELMFNTDLGAIQEERPT